ncbi:pre-RNA processing PIH1/Nop17-domain-containing protein [Cerioporus squamosus]|nr:pre-RNA processing PIH1/Nop17-domain-containing protein [Cerioporus squamosus]
MAPATTQVHLAPSAGFCVKSTAQNTVSVPTSDPAAPITIPAGLKVFVNIAWDANVPPPPDGSDAAIERAMSDNTPVEPDQALQWFVPVIVSHPRFDTDKAGKPSAVFDCIFHSSLKSRALRSPEFKTFLIELAFQRIEAQYSLLLSRQIGTPNIASKGKLKPRTVLVPTTLLQGSSAASSAASTSSSKPLIEELPASASTPAAPPKGILKKGPISSPSTSTSPATPAAPSAPHAEVPGLSWSRTPDGRLRIALSVPHLTRASIPSTTLDIEPRRLIFAAPPSKSPSPSASSSPEYALDLDLSAPDADILALFARSSNSSAKDGEKGSGHAALLLKRERALDVDGARAEWRVAEGLLVVYA